jgi:hypothetical protein
MHLLKIEATGHGYVGMAHSILQEMDPSSCFMIMTFMFWKTLDPT